MAEEEERNTDCRAVERDGSCFEFGTPNENLQQYDCPCENLESLLNLLPKTWVEQIATDWNVEDVSTWFPRDDKVAFYRISDLPLTYKELHHQIQQAPVYGGEALHVVAVLMPSYEMAEMAVVLLSLLSRPNVCAAPLDPNMPRPKLLDALNQLGCKELITTRGLLDEYDMLRVWADSKDYRKEDSTLLNLRTVHIVTPCPSKGAGAVNWTMVHNAETVEQYDLAENGPTHGTPVLLLRTSGTTAKPKIVPLTRQALLYNAVCLAVSLQLKRDDVGCNSMPLFHIGGIACALLAVLVSGSSVIMEGLFDPNSFLERLLTDPNEPNRSSDDSSSDDMVSPSWYYGVPTMHKSVLLAGKACLQQKYKDTREFLPTRLRFIRSGADHLPHQTAVELAKLFHVPVLSTYSMSECMPVCSANFDEAIVWDTPTKFIDSVGLPIGCSLRIVGDGDKTLRCEDGVGEVVIRGVGVLESYRDIPRSDTHTADGWLKTGDMGFLDKNGRLFLKGRRKHLIKRGGEQVWPDEVDDIIKKVPGVAVSVTFGVPNELWGEEVAVAVVLTAKGLTRGESDMKRAILETCRQSLDAAAVPCQIIFLESTDRLLKTPTGKLVRSGLADHLGVRSEDTRALSAMNAAVKATDPVAPHRKVSPSTALNGLRLLVACFVVQGHIGLYPSTAWLRIQRFSMNMQIFFFIGAFQLVCSVGEGLLETWAQFVGTKIGSMHALFVVSQFIALPSYLLFQCGLGGYQETFNDISCSESGVLVRTLVGWVIDTAVGITKNPVNGAAWFLAALYIFIVLFPWLDGRLRRLPPGKQGIVLVATMLISVFGFHFLSANRIGWWIFAFKFVAWLPSFVSAMIAGYCFLRYAPDSELERQEQQAAGYTRRLWPRKTTRRAIFTDFLSFVCLGFEIIVATAADCIWITLEKFVQMRPNEDIPLEMVNETYFDGRNETFVLACNITVEEYEEFIHGQVDSQTVGRWSTQLDKFAGFIILDFVFIWLWLYGLAHGHGATAYIMKTWILQKLSYLAYPVFLLHLPVSRYYWVATRGHYAEDWWIGERDSPPIFGDWYHYRFIIMPVKWYETLFIIAICLVVGALLDRFVVTRLMPYTMRFGVYVCKKISSCCRCRRRVVAPLDEATRPSTVAEQVEAMVKGLTGLEVTRSTNLHGIGLDSLGTTALLSILRTSVDQAKNLTMQELARFQNVGDLVDFLHAIGEEESPERKEDVV